MLVVAEAARGTRFLALDGLRGLAALVVLVHHIVLANPDVDALLSAGPDPAGSPLFWLIAYTPLHLLWAGSEAVYVFFILSGFVLALPFLAAKKPLWKSYYPRRLVRLYLPVWGSVAVAVALVWAVPRLPHPNASEWTALHVAPFNGFRDLALLGGTDYLNSPLWSLQVEVLFSLLLPGYLVLGHRLKKHWIAGGVGLLLVIGFGSVTHMPVLIFMPMFSIGVLMAMQRDVLEAWGRGLNRVAWVLVIAFASLLLTSKWVFAAIPASTALSAAGAALFVFAFLFCGPAIRLGTLRPIQWAGSRSFSLYLIHEPIVVSMAFVTGSSHPVLAAAVAVPLSLAAAELFFRGVERPSHVLAQRIGRRIEPPATTDGAPEAAVGCT